MKSAKVLAIKSCCHVLLKCRTGARHCSSNEPHTPKRREVFSPPAPPSFRYIFISTFEPQNPKYGRGGQSCPACIVNILPNAADKLGHIIVSIKIFHRFSAGQDTEEVRSRAMAFSAKKGVTVSECHDNRKSLKRLSSIENGRGVWDRASGRRWRANLRRPSSTPPIAPGWPAQTPLRTSLWL